MIKFKHNFIGLSNSSCDVVCSFSTGSLDVEESHDYSTQKPEPTVNSLQNFKQLSVINVHRTEKKSVVASRLQS